MIVITTPTGQIGHHLVARLLADDHPVRVIVRSAARLDPSVRERAEVVEGSHDDQAVLDRALPGAEALFLLVPPDPQAQSAWSHYLRFATVAAQALRRHGVGHVVGVSSAGYGWPKSAGLLSAAFAMDDELSGSGAAYRALGMPFYLENLDRNLAAIRDEGVLSLTYSPDRPLATVATRDIATTAAGLLADRTWSGQGRVPVFGPDRLTPVDMAEVMSEVLGRPVRYQRMDLADTASAMASRGASEQAVSDLTEMLAAQDEGIYDDDWAAATPSATGLRTWLEEVSPR